jgi:hypothetical protein
VRAGHHRAGAGLRGLAGARLAVNDYGSYSGCVGLRAAVAALFPGETSGVAFFAPDVLVTGGHRGSVEAVASGECDVACIDCVTWALLRSELSSPAHSLVVVGETPVAPAPPFVIPTSLAGTAIAQALFTGLEAACKSPAAKALGLAGVVRVGEEEPSTQAAVYTAAFTRLLAAATPAPIDARRAQVAAGAGYFERLDLCEHRCMPCGSTVPECQAWLNRGMLLYWGFNHHEALECFTAAAAADPTCWMPSWASAQAVATNYNTPTRTVAEMAQARGYAGRAARLLELAAAASAAAGGSACDRDVTELRRGLVRAQAARFEVGAARPGGAEDPTDDGGEGKIHRVSQKFRS